jgi:iron complex transport system ATP-binding protein
MLELRDLTFARGARTVLKDLRVAVHPGDMMAIIGPNGAGKTTLLKLIAGLLEPSAGEIVLNGRALPQWKRVEISRYAALVPQELEMPFAFRVEEIVAQGRVPHLGMFGGLRARDHQAVEDAMRAVDILGLRDRVYQQLSGGERQRVKIAIGLAQESRLMLLDEPTQHLDIGRQLELVSLLRCLNAGGITIVAAMHDLALVRQNFSTGILLTPEPAFVAGPIESLFAPELLERAFSIDRSALRGVLLPASDASAAPATTVAADAVEADLSRLHPGVKGRSRRHRAMAPGKPQR